ncbi:hypothetical protein E1301_Tti024179 [Triplophysa tibetana]|uniref:Uncharacterized protein n=1 Tax=Triplophysa tibetana TaxID=1572043 RepID=A0A5A9P3K4_9TELE|nr:hypothetical protein E1301_Tti024179 [Triplophysa tibetana]
MDSRFTAARLDNTHGIQSPKSVQTAPPLFCLNDFLQMSQSARGSLTELRNAVLSTFNYKKLLDLLLSELHRGARQLTAIIQLEARARNCGNTTEVCESVEELWGSPERERDTHTHPPPHTPHQLLNCVTSKHFLGSRRTRSPFRPREECDVISASELALLDCLTRGGLNLSFKAHFISHLPDLTSVAHCLQSLNASFNDLTRVPHEVCDCTGLQVLNLRDNPIEEIPPEINKLHKLHTLIISFCKITHLPKQLYSLVRLQYVDVSYNLIRSLSNDIRNLSLYPSCSTAAHLPVTGHHHHIIIIITPDITVNNTTTFTLEMNTASFTRITFFLFFKTR